MSRPFQVCLLTLLMSTAASAMIMVGRGNKPVADRDWPLGSLEVANLKTRVAWIEGPPFGGGQWIFYYQGDTAAFQNALDLLAKIRAPQVQLNVHQGPESSQFLQDEKDPKADTHVDWTFTVWTPRSWYQLNNNPMSQAFADSPYFRQSLPPPTIDVYVGGGGKIDWPAVKVPPNVRVSDDRADANGLSGSLIRGEVFDMVTSKSVADARIVLEKFSPPPGWEKVAEGKSDADGRFELKDLSPGSCRVSISADKYAPRSLGYVPIRANTLKSITVLLSPATAISGTIVDVEGKPLAGVSVRPSSTVGLDGMGYTIPDGAGTVTSDEQGKFTLGGLPSGYTALRAALKPYYHVDPFAVLPAPKQDVTIRMTLTGAIKGKVVDKVGDPVSGGIVDVAPPGDPIGKWGGGSQIKPDGTFEFEQVPPGTYFITAHPNPRTEGGKVPEPKQVEVKPGQTVEVQVEQSSPPARPTTRRTR